MKCFFFWSKIKIRTTIYCDHSLILIVRILTRDAIVAKGGLSCVGSFDYTEVCLIVNNLDGVFSGYGFEPKATRIDREATVF